MPTYQFQDKHTGEVFEQFMKISELDDFLKNHPDLNQIVTAPAVTGTMGKNTPQPKKKG